MITYITINMSEIALVDFNQVMETSEQTVRLSVDGLQTLAQLTLFVRSGGFAG